VGELQHVVELGLVAPGPPGLVVEVLAAARGVPVPGFASALAYYDTVRRDRLPAALVQGLRDFFGAHTYRRVDREGVFHTLWSEDRTEREV
jgi:6-phosphogluconate dehydrogenase